MKNNKDKSNPIKVGSILKTAKLLSFFAISSLALGFLIWNIYLGRLGFYEFNIIQARYIHAGVLFSLFIYTIFIFIKLVYKKIQDTKIIKLAFKKIRDTKKTGEGFRNLIILVSIISLIYIYTLYLFPYIPQDLGGAKPKLVSIIGDEGFIGYLSKFNVPISKSPIITSNLCIAYENQNFLVILLSNRVLSVKKDRVKGFNSVPTKQKTKVSKFCSRLSSHWVRGNASLFEGKSYSDFFNESQ